MAGTMGQDTMNVVIGNRKKYINFTVYLLLITILYACETPYQPIEYDLLNENGKRQAMVYKDEKSYNDLITKGSTSYADVFKFINKKYYSKKCYEMDIFFYSLEKHNVINIQSFEFEFEGNKKKININKKINLNKNMERYTDEIIFPIEGYDELSLNTFYYDIASFINKIKLDLHGIFNATNEDIGRYIELTLRMYYTLDKGEILIQENKHLVFIFEGKLH